jgi:cytochrome b
MHAAADPAQPPHAGAAPGTPVTLRRLVWDAPVRVFHALMIVSFAGAWLTGDSERWRVAHIGFGYTMAGLVAFRLLWGVVGTRHARFAAFVRGPSAALRYLFSLAQGRPEHHVGHNPAGALAIVGLLGLTAVVVASGWLTLNDLGGEWLEEWHEGAAEALLVLVGVHLAGVLAGSLAHRENLVGAMITGRKRATAAQGIPRAHVGVAALLLAAVIGFWIWQGFAAPAPTAADGTDRAASSEQPRDAGHGRRRGRDDDDD